jgi:transposase-like protein
MANKKKQHSNSFKAKVALEALKGEITLAEISSKFKIHSTQILRWKRQLLDSAQEVFSKSSDQTLKEKEKEIEELFKNIGQLKVELDWLKKKSGLEY